MCASLYLAGYRPVYEPWMYLYVAIIAFGGFMCWGALVFDCCRQYGIRDCPRWMVISGGMSMLIGLTPFGLMTLYMMNVALFISPAPIGASVIGVAFSIFGYYSFGMALVPRRIN